MRLSDAIRLGAMLKPQVFGVERGPVSVAHIGDVLSLRSVEGTCAFGAACDAGPVENFAITQVKIACCPACAIAYVNYVALAVVHLNDHHRWTREQIADWVEGVEAAQAHEQLNTVDAVGQLSEEPNLTTRA